MLASVLVDKFLTVHSSQERVQHFFSWYLIVSAKMQTMAQQSQRSDTYSDGVSTFDCECTVDREGFNEFIIGIDRICEDIDECTTFVHDCHIEAQCLNIPNSFDCACNIGFGGSGQLCSDVQLQVVASPAVRDNIAGLFLQQQPVVLVRFAPVACSRF